MLSFTTVSKLVSLLSSRHDSNVCIQVAVVSVKRIWMNHIFQCIQMITLECSLASGVGYAMLDIHYKQSFQSFTDGKSPVQML
eukprot:c21089_g1_i1 orf=85-333(+)